MPAEVAAQQLDEFVGDVGHAGGKGGNEAGVERQQVVPGAGSRGHHQRTVTQWSTRPWSIRHCASRPGITQRSAMVRHTWNPRPAYTLLADRASYSGQRSITADHHTHGMKSRKRPRSIIHCNIRAVHRICTKSTAIHTLNS